MDIQDLARQTIAVAAHHIAEPRPDGPPGWAPDDATLPYARTELRRLAYWSLDQNPRLRDELTARPADEELRRQAADGFAAELTRYPHLVPPVAAFVGRVLTPTPMSPTRPRGARWVLVAALGALAVVLAGAATAVILTVGKAGVAAATAPAPRLHTTLEFGALDLDQQPPANGLGRDVMAESGPLLLVTSGATGALYQGSEPATKQSCSDDLARNGVGATGLADSYVMTTQVRVGMAFCVSTALGNTAYLKITATTDSTVTADVMIWGR